MTHDMAIILIRLACACGVIIVCGFIGRIFRPSDSDRRAFVLPQPIGAAFVIAAWALAAATMVW